MFGTVCSGRCFQSDVFTACVEDGVFRVVCSLAVIRTVCSERSFH